MSITMPSTGRFGLVSILVVGFIIAAALMAVEARGQPAGKGKAQTERKPSPSLSSLPKPAATGPLKILVVDDDWSDNNAPGHQDAALSRSDKVFRQLAAQAVGGDAARWSITFAELYRDGPDLARLRDFNVVIWYNGGGYGGNPDNSSVLSREDEKTARRYLEETGGTFILVSPGYLANFHYGNSWTSAPVPFLKEVVGIDGFAGLAQRFDPGVVTAWDGSRYTVEALGHPEAQFSAVNPDGAAIVFSASIDPRKTADGPVAVAVAHPYGRGRFVYVGFSFENLPALELAPAFTRLLEAAGWPNPPPAVATSVPPQPPPPISPPVTTGITSAIPAPATPLLIKTPPAVIQSGGALRLPTESHIASPAQVTDAPWAFSLQGRDRQSFNFNTSHEGPIRLQVQATGAPVTVTVFHPDGRTKTQSGQGSFVVENQADAADVARGHVWAVSVRLSSPASDNAVVSGTIMVSHPPSDVAAVSAQLAAAKAKTVVLGKVPPLRSISSLPERLQVTDTALPVERTPLPAIVRPVVPVRRVPIATPTVRAPVARIQVVTPGNGPLIPADVVGVRDALYVKDRPVSTRRFRRGIKPQSPAIRSGVALRVRERSIGDKLVGA